MGDLKSRWEKPKGCSYVHTSQIHGHGSIQEEQSNGHDLETTFKYKETEDFFPLQDRSGERGQLLSQG